MSAVAQLVDQTPPEHVLPPRTGFLGASAPRADLGNDGIRPGLSTVVPAGAYRGTVAPPRRDIFLNGLRAGLEAHPEMRRTAADPATGQYKDVMGLERCMLLFELETSEADHGTGRDMRARRKEIAAAAGCSVKDVQRFHRLASRVMQVMVPIAEGRLLTLLERLDVWNRQLSPRLKQHGVSSVWAFHVPAWLRPFMAAAAIQPPPVDNSGRRRLRLGGSAPQPRSGDVPEANHPTYTSPSHPTSGSLRSPRGPGSARTASNKKGGDPPGRPLAIGLLEAMPLMRLTSPKRLQGALKRFAESRPVWTPQDLLDAFQTIRERDGSRGIAALTVNEIHTPWAFVISLLSQLHEHDDHPRLPFVDPAELRCGRTECDHGWIVDADCHVQELLGLPSNRTPQRRCEQCRPGAWPDPEPTVDDLLNGAPVRDDQEPPF